jgi:hypothetical protein
MSMSIKHVWYYSILYLLHFYRFLYAMCILLIFLHITQILLFNMISLTLQYSKINNDINFPR